MRNIWLALIPAIFVSFVSIGVVIYQLVYKNNNYILKIIAFICIAIAMWSFFIPYLKDMAEDKTTSIIAEYVGFQRNSKVGTRKVIFNEAGRLYELFVPGYAKDIGQLQEGKTYQIEYYNNSKLVKSYKLIEQNTTD